MRLQPRPRLQGRPRQPHARDAAQACRHGERQRHRRWQHLPRRPSRPLCPSDRGRLPPLPRALRRPVEASAIRHYHLGNARACRTYRLDDVPCLVNGRHDDREPHRPVLSQNIRAAIWREIISLTALQDSPYKFKELFRLERLEHIRAPGLFEEVLHALAEDVASDHYYLLFQVTVF